MLWNEKQGHFFDKNTETGTHTIIVIFKGQEEELRDLFEGHENGAQSSKTGAYEKLRQNLEKDPEVKDDPDKIIDDIKASTKVEFITGDYAASALKTIKTKVGSDQANYGFIVTLGNTGDSGILEGHLRFTLHATPHFCTLSYNVTDRMQIVKTEPSDHGTEGAQTDSDEAHASEDSDIEQKSL